MGNISLRYDKKNLIKVFIRDIFSVIVPRKLAGIGGITTDTLISNIELTPDHIKFELSQKAMELMGLVDEWNTRKYLLNFHGIWKDRIFEGANGYYIFGDILNDDIIEVASEKIKSLIFPFYKIEYHSYLDNIPDEIKVIILSYLSGIDIRTLMILYSDLKNTENMFLLLIKQGYPTFYNMLSSVYPDVTSEDKKDMTYQKLYGELQDMADLEKKLKKLDSDHNVLSDYAIGYKFRDVMVIVSYYIAKREYPYIYNKILQTPSLGNTVFDMRKLTFMRSSGTALSDYLKTGNIASQILVNPTLDYDPYLLYLLLLDYRELDFASYLDYLYLLSYVVKRIDYTLPLFNKLGTEELIRIIDTPRPHNIKMNKFERLMLAIFYYIINKREQEGDEIFRSFITNFTINRFKELTDRYSDKRNLDMQRDIETILKKYSLN